MSDAGWDDDNFEPEAATVKNVVPPVTDKWEGEDEDDDVKANWEDSDESSSDDSSKDDADPNAPKAVQRPKKKKLADILIEKEQKKVEEADAAAATASEEAAANTPEGKAAEKMRIRKQQEDESYAQALDMLGLNNKEHLKDGSIDSMAPETKEEFEEFGKATIKKVQTLSSSTHYPEFVEQLIKDLCIDLNAATLKKIKMNVEAFHTTKLKDEKTSKPNKKKPGLGKVKMDLSKDMYGDTGGGYDDMDDFM